MRRLFSTWLTRQTLLELSADFVLIVFVIAIAVRWHDRHFGIDAKTVLIYAVLFSLVMLPVNALLGLYQYRHGRTVVDSWARVALAMHLAVPVAYGIIVFLLLEHNLQYLELSGLAALFLVLANRVRIAHTVRRAARDRVLIYGVGHRAKAVKQELERVGHVVKIVGCYPCTDDEVAEVKTERILPRTRSLTDTVQEFKVDEIIIAVTERRGGVLPLRELLNCRVQGVRVYDLAGYFEQTMGQIRLDALYAGWLIFGEGFGQGTVRTWVKRIFDIGFALALLILASPLMLLAALAIAMESGFPIFYGQERVGLNGRPFNVVKFRSMRRDAEQDGKPRWATVGDARITRVGRFMRKTRIDELPQLFSVMLGDMSLVGPRPERPYFVERLTREIPFYGIRHSVKPGLTGWAQVRYHYGASVEDAAEKLQYDLYYVKNHSLVLDLMILLETIGVVLTGKGAN